MKKLLTMSGALFGAMTLATLLASPVLACDGDKDHKSTEAPKAAPPAKQLKTASFHVDGMHCDGCGDKVKAALAKIDGVHKVDVKTADKRVTVDYDAAKISADKISKLITEKTGYKAAPEA